MKIYRKTEVEVKLPKIKEATLLTADQFNECKDNIPDPQPDQNSTQWTGCWYLREDNPTYDDKVPFVEVDRFYGEDEDFYTEYDYDDDGPYNFREEIHYGTGTRPVLVFETSLLDAGLQIGDEIWIYGNGFTVISENLALSKAYISTDIYDEATNVYDDSMIKQRIDKWFEDEIKNNV